MKKILCVILVLMFLMQGCFLQKESNFKNGLSLENKNQELSNQTINVEEDVAEIIKIPDTNQKYCYDDKSTIDCSSKMDFYGQDAQYEINKVSYRDNGDGTITDLNTNLMWIKDAGDKAYYYDRISGVSDFEYVGYDDWRVPTIKELYSLIDFSGSDVSSESQIGGTPFIDDSVFVFEYGDIDSGDRIIDSQWITSNIYTGKVMGNNECFFGVNFADGRIKCYPTREGGNNGYFLRLVRGNSNYGINDFVDNGDDTITDRSTNLMWMRKDSLKSMIWEDALSYCENSNLAGYDDWRLPNAKELEYIVDYSRSPDKTNSPAINPIFDLTSITNEAGKKDWGYYWSGTTHADQGGGSTAVYISFGRALGNMQEFGGWIDVHGAGAQRSDPKSGDPNDYKDGHGPQGDAIRIYNYVRCVRAGDIKLVENIDVPKDSTSNIGLGSNAPEPPQEAIDACNDLSSGNSCSINTPKGVLKGSCTSLNSQLICVPENMG